MILFTVEQAVACANRCAEVGDIPCWEVEEDCSPCAECVAQGMAPEGRGREGGPGSSELPSPVPEGNAP